MSISSWLDPVSVYYAAFVALIGLVVYYRRESRSGPFPWRANRGLLVLVVLNVLAYGFAPLVAVLASWLAFLIPGYRVAKATLGLIAIALAVDIVVDERAFCAETSGCIPLGMVLLAPPLALLGVALVIAALLQFGRSERPKGAEDTSAL